MYKDTQNTAGLCNSEVNLGELACCLNKWLTDPNSPFILQSKSHKICTTHNSHWLIECKFIHWCMYLCVYGIHLFTSIFTYYHYYVWNNWQRDIELLPRWCAPPPHFFLITQLPIVNSLLIYYGYHALKHWSRCCISRHLSGFVLNSLLRD